MIPRLKILLFPVLVLLLTGFAAGARAHSIHYSVEQKGMAVRAYYGENDPAVYSQYELYGPGDKEPHQLGRVDKNGYVAFVPDRPGTWKLKVWGESTHGFHGVSTEIKVDKDLALSSVSKPLVATYTKFITGISLIIGLFGLYAFWLSRRRKAAPGTK